MSRQARMEIGCPECGRQHTCTVWHSINVTLHPELREELFEGRVNIFRCGCGNVAPAPVMLMYHDMARQFCISYYPLAGGEESVNFRDFTEEGKFRTDFGDPRNPASFAAASRIPRYMSEQVVVFDLAELMRQVVFRERLHEHYSSNDQ